MTDSDRACVASCFCCLVGWGISAVLLIKCRLLLNKWFRCLARPIMWIVEARGPRELLVRPPIRRSSVDGSTNTQFFTIGRLTSSSHEPRSSKTHIIGRAKPLTIFNSNRTNEIYIFINKTPENSNQNKKRGCYVRRHRTTIHLYPEYPLEGDSLDRRGYRIPIPAAGIQVSVSPSIRVSTYPLLAEDRSGYPFAGEYGPKCHGRYTY